MRVPQGNITELESILGPRGALIVTSDNRANVQKWLMAQGLPSYWVKSLRLKTLAKAYNRPGFVDWAIKMRDEGRLDKAAEHAESELAAETAAADAAAQAIAAGVQAIAADSPTCEVCAQAPATLDNDGHVYCSHHASMYRRTPVETRHYVPPVGHSGTGSLVLPPPPVIAPIPTTTPATKPQESQTVPPVSRDKLAQLGDLLAGLVEPASVQIDESTIVDLILKHTAHLQPRTAEIIIRDASTDSTRAIGRQHKQFPTLLQACQARDHNGHRLNIWLSGTAGSGKTTAAKYVAAALDLPFYFNGAIDNEHKLLGFTDAQGRIVSRPFRQAYANGGVYLFDEVDGSLPGALLSFNAATANGACDFPDGIIERHKDCVIIAAANTWGHGAGSSGFVGRMKQDAAFLDRFAMLPWDIDEALEMDLAADSAWCSTVQTVRNNVKRQGLQIIVSPRATIMGCSLLATGMDRETVIAMTLRKGMNDDQWEQVKPAA